MSLAIKRALELLPRDWAASLRPSAPRASALVPSAISVEYYCPSLIGLRSRLRAGTSALIFPFLH